MTLLQNEKKSLFSAEHKPLTRQSKTQLWRIVLYEKHTNQLSFLIENTYLILCEGDRSLVII